MSEPVKATMKRFSLSSVHWNSIPPAVYGLIVLGVLAVFLAPHFFSLPFFLLMLRQAAPLGLLAIGQSLVVLNRSLDLSVGGTVAITNIILASRAWPSEIVPEIKFLAVIVLGGLIGLVNGTFVAYLRSSAVVITLGMATILIGLSLLVSGGTPGNMLDPFFIEIGRGRFLGVPISALLWIGVAVAGAILMKTLTFGKFVSMTGDNPQSAELTGVPVGRVFLVSHVICGITAALGGICLSGLIGVGSLEIGQDLVLASIAAVILGGVTFGGKGGILGSILGAFLLIVLTNLLNILNVGEPGKLFFQGLIIIAAAAFYVVKSPRSG
jgi:ribose transport system permease protein